MFRVRRTPRSSIITSYGMFNLYDFCPKSNCSTVSLKPADLVTSTWVSIIQDFRQCLPEVSEYLRAIWLFRRILAKNSYTLFFLHATHTPARTLVMSRTRIPANGSVGKSAAAVARPLQSGWWRPLSRMRGLRYLARPIIDVLETAIMHQEMRC